MKKQLPRAKQGFTLVEMLCTIVVLLLLSGLMATGVRLAVETFRQSVTDSEAQVLCSTLRTAVSDELRYSGMTDAASKPITFFSQSFGQGSSFTTDAETGQVLLNGKKFLSKNAYPDGLRAAVTLEKYDAGTRIFTAAVTVTNADGTELAAATFEVKQLNIPVDPDTSGTT